MLSSNSELYSLDTSDTHLLNCENHDVPRHCQMSLGIQSQPQLKIIYWDLIESGTIKKAKCWRIDAFELWCWRRHLRVPWTARRSNQSILKEISPGCSLEGLMLRPKLQYFGHLMQKVDSFEKTLMLGGIGGRRRGWQRMRWIDGITDSWVWVNSGSWWWTGRPGVLWFMESQRVGHDWATELNWTDILLTIVRGIFLISFLNFYCYSPEIQLIFVYEPILCNFSELNC